MGKGIPWIACLLAGRASALSPEPTHSSRLISGSAGSHTHVSGDMALEARLGSY